ncbi:MAG: ParB/RepB/Spo0J family partition protein [Terriglobales bacterium]
MKRRGPDVVIASGGGGPLMIPIDLIDEDPHQPRSQDNPGFRPESIGELAASFGPKGPKTPLSLRENSRVSGRFIINHGHRRYRAGKLKGLTHLPAFIDNEYDDADQVIENLQRENMTPREMADYIGRELAKGKKKGEIAERIGKSPSFVSQHVTLLDLPEPIAVAFNGGRVNDVTLVNELVTAYRSSPAEVESWLGNPAQEVTRASVKLLREYLSLKMGKPVANAEVALTARERDGEGLGPGAAAEQKQRPSTHKPRAMYVQVQHLDRVGHLVIDRRPSSSGYGWLQYEDGAQVEVLLADLRLLAIIDAM